LRGGLGETYDDHLRLIGKRVVDFLLLLIELFSLGVTAEALRVNIGSKSAISLTGACSPRISGGRGRRFSSRKTTLNDFSYGIKIWTVLSSVLSQCTRLTDGQTDGRTDRQTDRHTAFSSPDRVCIPCSAVKID